MTAREELELGRARILALEKRLEERQQQRLKRILRWARETGATPERAEKTEASR